MVLVCHGQSLILLKTRSSAGASTKMPLGPVEAPAYWVVPEKPPAKAVDPTAIALCPAPRESHRMHRKLASKLLPWARMKARLEAEGFIGFIVANSIRDLFARMLPACIRRMNEASAKARVVVQKTHLTEALTADASKLGHSAASRHRRMIETAFRMDGNHPEAKSCDPDTTAAMPANSACLPRPSYRPVTRSDRISEAA